MYKTDVLFRSGASSCRSLAEKSNDIEAHESAVSAPVAAPVPADGSAQGRQRMQASAEEQLFSLSNPSLAVAQSLPEPLMLSQQHAGQCLEVVMDPLAALRRCIRHFAANPDVYGTDLHALLAREVTFVTRLKDSEAALVPTGTSKLACGAEAAQTEPGEETVRLPPLTRRKDMGSTVPVGRRNIGGKTLAHSTTSTTRRRAAARQGQEAASTPLSGFGGGTLTLTEPSSGLLSLMGSGDQGGGNGAGYRGAYSTVGGPAAEVREEVQWGGGPATQSPLPVVDKAGTALSGGVGVVPVAPDSAVGPGRNSSGPTAFSSAAARRTLHNDGNVGAAARVVVLDAVGYEVTFLQNQLQQTEAAYTAKCVRLHELTEDNKRLLSQLATVDESARTWQRQCNAAQTELDAMRRELEAWRGRAADVTAGTSTGNGGAAAGTLTGRRASLVRRAQSNQLNEVKQEVSKLTQLWRETERALQEARRTFENSEKEATQSHDHLSDAFHYIERLERRVARRDAYLATCMRRQASLEEKYEKLMWCYQELGCLTGAYSYADYLLADEPVWTLVLFTRLQRHVGCFAPTETPPPPLPPAPASLPQGGGAALVAEARLSSRGSALAYLPSPRGGRLVDAFYDIAMVYRMMANEVTAVDERRGRAKRLRTNLHGSVGCRVLRWQGLFALDFLGGEDSYPDSCELNRKKQPLLTLGSLLLPLCRPDGTVMSAAAPTAAEASAATVGDGGSGRTAFLAVPNTSEYDQGSLRYILRAFWRERLEQYRRNMLLRIKSSVDECRRVKRREVRKRQRASALLDNRSIADISDSSDRDEVEDEGSAFADENAVRDYTSGFDKGHYGSTFLGALVEFVQNHTDGTGPAATSTTAAATSTGGNKRGGGTASSNAEWVESMFANTCGGDEPVARKQGSARQAEGMKAPPRYIVRGVTHRPVPGSAADSKEIWDNGRVFFASVLHPETEQSADGANSSLPPGAGHEGPLVLTISAKARELLCALYYVTLEFKDGDADFRLFYLVSHQLVPEMVAVNFFASIEAFEQECYSELRSSLVTPTTRRSSGKQDQRKSSEDGEGRGPRREDDEEDGTRDGAEGHEAAFPFSNFHFGGTDAVLADIEGEEAASPGTVGSGGNSRQSSGKPPAHDARDCLPRTRATIVKSPLDALCRVAELVDRTALAGEDEKIDEDSDGEGYGSILPGSTASAAVPVGEGTIRSKTAALHRAGSGAGDRARTAAARRGTAALRVGPAASWQSPKESDGTEPNARSTTTIGDESCVVPMEDSPQTAATGEDTAAAASSATTLVHNIREYLNTLAQQKKCLASAEHGVETDEPAAAAAAADGGPRTSLLSRRDSLLSSSPFGDGNINNSTAAAEASRAQLPLRWEQLDSFVRNVLGPHMSLLKAFRGEQDSDDTTAAANGGRPFLAQQRARRVEFTESKSRTLSAARGLLPLDSVLRVLTHHLFTSYAVACCGTPRFSLAETLMPFGSSRDWGRYLTPLTPVGQLPALEGHLKRLRFALALDQPSSLIRFTDVFAFDPHTGNPTHLYDELLSLWLDVCQQQQCFLMDVVQRACASRHERFMSEGAEDCDGSLPISTLRRGVRGAFSELGFAADAADALVEHLVHYTRLLREEDDIQSEQFTDGPFYINAREQQDDGQPSHGSRDGDARAGEGKQPLLSARASASEGEWDFGDEAESCSLLHVALAVRMLYIVWGYDSATSTRKLSETLATIPLHVPFSQYRSQQQHSYGHDMPNGGASGLRASVKLLPPPPAAGASTAPRSAVHSFVIQDDATREVLVLRNFKESAKAAYALAIQRLALETDRLSAGGDARMAAHLSEPSALPLPWNPLRRALTHFLEDTDGIANGEARRAGLSPSLGGKPADEALYPTALPLASLATSAVRSVPEGAVRCAESTATAQGGTSGRLQGKGATAGAKAKPSKAKTGAAAAASPQPPDSKDRGEESFEGRESSLDTAIPAEVLRAVHGPPPDTGLYTLSRLLGLTTLARGNGGTGRDRGDEKRTSHTKRRKAAQSGPAVDIGRLPAGLASVAAASVESYLSQMHERFSELRQPLLAAHLDTTTTTRAQGLGASGGGGVERSRGKASVVVTTDAAPPGPTDAPDAAVGEAKKPASFVASEDVAAPTQGSVRIGSPPAANSGRPRGGAPFSFALDWAPANESATKAGGDPSMAHGKVRGVGSPPQNSGVSGVPSLLKSPAKSTKDTSTLHVSLLQGTCAALSLV